MALRSQLANTCAPPAAATLPKANTLRQHRAAALAADAASISATNHALLNALTIDVEDYYHVAAFESCVARADWDCYESRVAANTYRLLDLLDARGVKATFFVLGWVAERHPALLREIDNRGHQIGCHSHWHRLVYQLSHAEFRRDLCHSHEVIAQALGRPVPLYRAPSFSITRQSWWALQILAEEGFTIDSSIVPARHDLYGVPDAPTTLHQISTPGGTLWECPPAVISLAGLRLPVGGGGYFRLFPLWWTTRWLRRINALGRPFVFYLHPWEIDPDQPRFAHAPRRSRFRHYVGLRRTAAKFQELLARFNFGPLGEVVRRYAAQAISDPSPLAGSPPAETRAAAAAPLARWQ